LEVDELLIEFADARFDFLEIVGEALELCGHGIEASAGIGLNILDGLLERGHSGIELVDGVGGLLHEGFLDSMVLGHLGLKSLLTLEESADVALELDNFAGDGESGPRADDTAGESAGEHSAGKEKNVTSAHKKASKERRDGKQSESQYSM
jgi:hypothetical protein